MKEFVTMDRLETQITDENNETFRHETVEFRTALQQSCMMKKKGKDARRSGVNAARRADDTVETPETACLLSRKRTSRSTLFLSNIDSSFSRC